MKNYYLFLFLLFGFFGKAQIITIPDTNFKAKLLAASPSNTIAKNLSGTYFKIDANSNAEIEVSEALNVSTLNVQSSNISSLQEINQFSNLTILNCSYNQLTDLNLTSLVNLIDLNCRYNQLVNLNITGLISLYNFDCTNNQLTSLNANNLVNLSFLYCNFNQLTNLTFSGCTNLTNVECSYNNLTSLNVTGLNNLFYLKCINNLLTEINCTGISKISTLWCENNQFVTLNLTNFFFLSTLLCQNNNQLVSLFIKNGTNEETSLYGNSNLQYICADESQISSIQNSLNNYGFTNCQLNSYCSFATGGTFYTIQGQNRFDNENDGCDSSDGFISNVKYSISNGTTTGSIISNNIGNYSIPVQAGIHTITPILENPSYFNVSPANVVVNFPSQTSPFTQNFCITPNGIMHDVEISIIPTSVARPDFDCHYQIIYKNKGNQLENGTISLVFDDAIFDLIWSSASTSSQTFGNLNWNYSNLQPLETRTINVVLNLNSPMETPAVNANDILNLIATITSPNETPCNNWLQSQCDNVFTLNQTVVNSYDPNDKTCLQGNTISPDRVGGYVHYMIRFENTGTFPAENIVVKDMIDTTKFDVSSLVPLHASHNYFTKVTGNKVEFIFENINLPFDDANNDGYIAFKIKTVPTLVVGNTFSNSANIYFDYNFPIITNTATTTIAALSNPSFEFANYFSLYPNPTTNELNINLKSAIEIHSIQIYNTIGQLITVQTGNALKVDVSNLKTGNYFIKINTNEGYSTSQFIKE